MKSKLQITLNNLERTKKNFFFWNNLLNHKLNFYHFRLFFFSIRTGKFIIIWNTFEIPVRIIQTSRGTKCNRMYLYKIESNLVHTDWIHSVSCEFQIGFNTVRELIQFFFEFLYQTGLYYMVWGQRAQSIYLIFIFNFNY